MPAALVTGGGTGIGRATAHALSRAGYRVAVAGRRREPLEEAVAPLGDGLVVVGDHADEQDATRFVAETVEALGSLDVVVDNAGAIRRNLPVHEIPVERFDDQVRISLRGPFLVAQAALRAGWSRRRRRASARSSTSPRRWRSRPSRASRPTAPRRRE